MIHNEYAASVQIDIAFAPSASHRKSDPVWSRLAIRLADVESVARIFWDIVRNRCGKYVDADTAKDEPHEDSDRRR